MSTENHCINLALILVRIAQLYKSRTLPVQHFDPLNTLVLSWVSSAMFDFSLTHSDCSTLCQCCTSFLSHGEHLTLVSVNRLLLPRVNDLLRRSQGPQLTSDSVATHLRQLASSRLTRRMATDVVDRSPVELFIDGSRRPASDLSIILTADDLGRELTQVRKICLEV